MTNIYPEPSQGQNPPQPKLVLPGPPNAQYPPNVGDQTYVYAEQPAQQQAPPPLPSNPLAKFRRAVRTDPAYKVLMIAIITVLVSSIIFLTLANNIFAQFSSRSAQTSIQSTSLPLSPTEQQPTFTTPTGGQGSTTSSQPPQPPTPTPLPTEQPTLPPVLPTLALLITNIPQQVINNTTVPVLVTSNEPGITVRLTVDYTVSPNHYISKAQITDANGAVSLSWHIQVSTNTLSPVLAQVTAIAQDQNGQQASSQTVTVLIITTRFGI